MKTPKEYAEELVNKYDETLTYLESRNKAKQCALIAVDEILENFGLLCDGNNFYAESRTISFYQKVKQEIEKL